MVDFRVEAESPAPGIAYQWFFDATNFLTGATNAVLELTNVQPVQFGAHRLHQSVRPDRGWLTLDTVTLTNTTQFYYDLTAFGQPARLYHVVPLP